MFTLDQILEASKKVKSGADFPQLVQDLKAIGVRYYINFVADGKTKYYGTTDFLVEGKEKYPEMNISPESSADKLKSALQIHQQGQTDYLTFCKHSAEAGVEKWETDLVEMTVTYLDRQGNKLVTESIPQV
ncbi:MAG: phage envelope protein [Bacteroidetes bacterium]|jgi:uncharacterized protein YbcV (DUF1398 family)|nr:phage envelope protein [Bacteroidota bacterium]